MSTDTLSGPLTGYPTRWKDFIGQEEAKEQLITAAKSAKMRKTRMPHTLLGAGIPGIGKTTLAMLIATEMGGGCEVVSGKVTVHDARYKLSKMKDGGVLVIDEAHRMVQGGKANIEWLLHYMENGVLMLPRGPEPQPAVTIVAATTEPGSLPTTILDRFALRPVLAPYTDAEATKIAGLMAKGIIPTDGYPRPSTRCLGMVARAASNNPRLIRSILNVMRDDVLVHGWKGRWENTVLRALTGMGLTEDGLTRTCKTYMLVLLNDFAGQPAGAAALKDRLQEPGGLGETERLLMDKGLLVKSSNGRFLSSAGLRRARDLDAA